VDGIPHHSIFQCDCPFPKAGKSTIESHSNQPLTRRKNMPTSTTGPQGELLMRTIPMPADTSFNGDVFGGWIMSQMDLAGSIMAKETTRTRTTTVAVESMQFIKPVRVGDVVCCYGRVKRIGTTSVTIMLEVWVRPILHGRKDQFTTFKVTEAAFTYVAVDGEGKKQPIDKTRFGVEQAG
jgi:acyl-CoA thioesterase YciA